MRNCTAKVIASAPQIECIEIRGIIREMLMGYFVPAAENLRTDEWHAQQAQQQ